MSDALDQPPVEDAAAPPAVETAPETETPIAEAERDVEADTLEIPDSSQADGKAKYVPAAALAGARRELKELKAERDEAKAGSAKAERLEQQIADLQAQFNQILPQAQAYQAAIASQQHQPAVEDDADAIELAQTLDLYTADGKPDVVKARKMQAIVARTAGQQADARVAPIQQRDTANASKYNLQRALNTDIGGEKPDEGILRALWSQLDPSVTANEEQAKLLVIQALGLTRVQGAKGRARTATGQFTQATEKASEAIPPPLVTEKAGGRDTPQSPAMSEMEQKMAKDMGLTNQQYLERARGAHWLR